MDNSYIKLKQYYWFYCIFDQINSALVRIRKFFFFYIYTYTYLLLHKIISYFYTLVINLSYPVPSPSLLVEAGKMEGIQAHCMETN